MKSMKLSIALRALYCAAALFNFVAFFTEGGLDKLTIAALFVALALNEATITNLRRNSDIADELLNRYHEKLLVQQGRGFKS